MDDFSLKRNNDESIKDYALYAVRGVIWIMNVPTLGTGIQPLRTLPRPRPKDVQPRLNGRLKTVWKRPLS